MSTMVLQISFNQESDSTIATLIANVGLESVLVSGFMFLKTKGF
jgi:hypothetical protein